MDSTPILQEAVEILRKGGVILYPTDTVWGIGCDATNTEAVNRVYRLNVQLFPLTKDFKGGRDA